MLERTHDGRAFRILNVIDEYSRECLAIRVGRNPDHEDVQECLTELFYTYGDLYIHCPVYCNVLIL